MCPQITKVTQESSFYSGFGWWWVRAGEAQEAAEIDSKNDVHNQGRWKLVLLTQMGFGEDAQCMWLMGTAAPDVLAQQRAWEHDCSMRRVSKSSQFREWDCPRCVHVLSSKCMKFHPCEEANCRVHVHINPGSSFKWRKALLFVLCVGEASGKVLKWSSSERGWSLTDACGAEAKEIAGYWKLW